MVNQSLTAKELYLRDKHYLIDDGKVVIVDEFTGRMMPDRTWRDGLHQAIEAKERVEINPPKDTYARISFQRFFRMYHTLSGMSRVGPPAGCSFYTSESSGLSISGGFQAERGIIPGTDPARFIFTKTAPGKLLSLTPDGQ
jgi:hypothetical protein